MSFWHCSPFKQVYLIKMNCHAKSKASRDLDLSPRCEHSLRALTLLACHDLLDLIIPIIVFVSVTLITRLPPFCLVLSSPSSFLLSAIYSIILFPSLWGFAFLLLHLIISLRNSLRWEITQASNPSSRFCHGIRANKQLLPVSVHNYCLRTLYSTRSLVL